MVLSRRRKGTGTERFNLTLSKDAGEKLLRVCEATSMSKSRVLSMVLAAVDETLLIEDLIDIASCTPEPE